MALWCVGGTRECENKREMMKNWKPHRRMPVTNGKTIHHFHIIYCVHDIIWHRQTQTSLNLPHQIFKINCAKMFSFLQHSFTSIHFATWRCCQRKREGKRHVEQTWKLNKSDMPCMFHAQPPTQPPIRTKTVAHCTTYAELKNTSSFGQNGAPIERIAMKNTFEIWSCSFSLFTLLCLCLCHCRVCLFVRYSYVSALPQCVYGIVAFYMIKSKPCVLKLSPINNNNNE